MVAGLSYRTTSSHYRSKHLRRMRSEERDRRSSRGSMTVGEHVWPVLLRRPHDHHRDLRARLSAETPTHTSSGSDQDRHIMRPSLPIDHRYDTRNSCWLAARHAQARICTIDSQPVSPPNLSSTVHKTERPVRTPWPSGANSQSYRQRLVRNARQAPSHLI